MLPPKRTVIGGQKHELAYINKGEKALLRSRGGGVTPGGGQLKKNGVNAFGGGGPPSAGPSIPVFQHQWLQQHRLVGAPPLAAAATVSDPTPVAEVTASLQRRREAEARNPVTTTGGSTQTSTGSTAVSSTAVKRKKLIGVLGDTNTATGIILGS